MSGVGEMGIPLETEEAVRDGKAVPIKGGGGGLATWKKVTGLARFGAAYSAAAKVLLLVRASMTCGKLICRTDMRT